MFFKLNCYVKNIRTKVFDLSRNKFLFFVSIFTLLMFITAALTIFTSRTNPNELKAGKLIEWGWDTPFPTIVREHIQEMEKLPFDGLVMDLTINNDKTDLPYSSGLFSWADWGSIVLKYEDYSQAIEAIKNTQFKRFTDNFIRFNVTPGTVDWYDKEFKAVIVNGRIAAQVAKDCNLKGILLDVENYQGKVFDYASQKKRNERSFSEYQTQVRRRGREFMESLNSVYPDITIILTWGYHTAYTIQGSLETNTYGLLPSFLDGMLEVAEPNTLIFDGWEFAYAYKTEPQFQEAYYMIRNLGLERTRNKEAFSRHYRASFGLMLDFGRVWNENDFTKNHFTPEAFESSVRYGLKHTDRYVWIYSEKPNWWPVPQSNPNLSFVKIPQPYIDALTRAREP